MNLEINPLIILFAVINIVAFLMMLWDKMQSTKKGADRISEGMLFFLATMFGSIGIYAGMILIRHKSRKWYFIIGIPALIAQNLATLYVIQLWHLG
ncbi:MAG: DUF1294 domain-containing protein [Patescibacteria group bacterium]